MANSCPGIHCLVWLKGSIPLLVLRGDWANRVAVWDGPKRGFVVWQQNSPTLSITCHSRSRVTACHMWQCEPRCRPEELHPNVKLCWGTHIHEATQSQGSCNQRFLFTLKLAPPLSLLYLNKMKRKNSTWVVSEITGQHLNDKTFLRVKATQLQLDGCG